MAANFAIFPIQIQNRRERHVNRVQNPLEVLNDQKLFKRYRFSRENILYISDLLRERLERETGRSHSLSVEFQVLIALRFFASGAFLELVGDTLGVDKGTVSRVVRDVAAALHDMRHAAK